MLIVVGLIGTLAAIGLPMYLRALDRARVTRAMGDIKNIALTLTTARIQLGQYPDALAEVDCGQIRDPWGRLYVYLKLEGKKGNGGARKDKNLVPLNSDFDLYSVGPDGRSTSALTAKASRDDVVRANNGAYIGLAADY